MLIGVIGQAIETIGQAIGVIEMIGRVIGQVIETIGQAIKNDQNDRLGDRSARFYLD